MNRTEPFATNLLHRQMVHTALNRLLLTIICVLPLTLFSNLVWGTNAIVPAVMLSSALGLYWLLIRNNVELVLQILLVVILTLIVFIPVTNGTGLNAQWPIYFTTLVVLSGFTFSRPIQITIVGLGLSYFSLLYVLAESNAMQFHEPPLTIRWIDVMVCLTLLFFFTEMTFTAFGRTLTETQQESDTRKEREAELQVLLNSIPDIMLRFDRTGLCTQLNVPPSLSLPVPIEQILNHHLHEFLSHTHYADVWGVFKQVLATGKSRNIELTGGDCLGKHEWRISRLGDDEIVVMVRDLSEQWQTEQELAEQKMLFQAIVENVHDSITIINNDGDIKYQSPASKILLGYSPDEVTGKPSFDLIIAEDRHKAQQFLQDVTRTESTVRAVLRMHHRDGTIRYVDVIAEDELNTLGIHGVILTSRDVTAQVAVEMAFEQERLHLAEQVKLRTAELSRINAYQQAVLDAATEVIITATDTNGLFTIFNRGAEQFLQYTNQEVIGKHTSRLFHLPEELAARQAELSTELGHAVDERDVLKLIPRQQGMERREWTYRRKDGTQFVVDLIITPVRDPQNQLMGYLGIAMDLTRRKQVETKLIEAKLLAEAANQAKSSFLANMSHELRTPLNAVIGMSDILLEQIVGPLNEKQEKYTHTINKSGLHLLDLINDVLDLSKIDADRLNLNRQEVNLVELIEATLVMVRQSASRKDINLQRQVTALPDPIYIDPVRLKQILVNLVSNAIKFTEPGGNVLLSVTTTPAEIRFEVQDNGSGIPQDKLETIFDPFVQLDAGLDRRHEGTGLGLALVERLVKLHDGRVTVDSTVGEGSLFRVVMPNVQPTHRPEQTSVSEFESTRANNGLTPLRILVVEDNLSNIDTICHYLELNGHETVVAYNGQEAVQISTELPPDIILMDIQMPIMDGIEATRQIRANPTTAHIPILALTALVQSEEETRCRNAGVDDFMRKPIRLSVLKEKLRTYQKNF